jgi:hypothetical protein
MSFLGPCRAARTSHLPGVDALAAPTLTHVPIRDRMLVAEEEMRSNNDTSAWKLHATALAPAELVHE